MADRDKIQDEQNAEVAQGPGHPVSGFYGNFEHALDSKGRVALPSNFRSPT